MEQRGPHGVSERRAEALRWIRTPAAWKWRQRFFAKVHEEPTSGCFLWSGTQNQFRYGICTLHREPFLAHRAAYALEYGAELSHLVLRHSCDNPTCVNPRHLTSGTQLENNRDMFRRGRARQYQRAPLITELAVAALREEGLNKAEIARKLQIGWRLVDRILARRAA